MHKIGKNKPIIGRTYKREGLHCSILCNRKILLEVKKKTATLQNVFYNTAADQVGLFKKICILYCLEEVVYGRIIIICVCDCDLWLPWSLYRYR